MKKQYLAPEVESLLISIETSIMEYSSNDMSVKNYNPWDDEA